MHVTACVWSEDSYGVGSGIGLRLSCRPANKCFYLLSQVTERICTVLRSQVQAPEQKAAGGQEGIVSWTPKFLEPRTASMPGKQAPYHSEPQP